MKKILNRFSALILGAIVCAALLVPATASAQIDLFNGLRSIVLSQPTNQPTVTSVGAFTNGPIDISGYIGTAVVDIFSYTNTGGTFLTAQLLTGNNATNGPGASGLTNYALINSYTSYYYTNTSQPGYYTNVVATNMYLLPGTITTPTASSSGYATPYLNTAANPFTNTSSIAITNKLFYRVGFRVQDAQRYLWIVYTASGSTTNYTVGAVFNGIRYNEVQ